MFKEAQLLQIAIELCKIHQIRLRSYLLQWHRCSIRVGYARTPFCFQKDLPSTIAENFRKINKIRIKDIAIRHML